MPEKEQAANLAAERKTAKFELVLMIRTSKHDMRTPFASFKLFLVVTISENVLVDDVMSSRSRKEKFGRLLARTVGCTSLLRNT